MSVQNIKTDDPVADTAIESASQIDSADDALTQSVLDEPKISGFDEGPRSVLRQPSLYLSVAVLVIASSLSPGGSPALFMLVLFLLCAAAIVLHIVAERSLFMAEKANRIYSAPCEGVFVLIFGAALPGIALLAYASFAMFSSPPSNWVEFIGKTMLLLTVPVFNYLVWASVRKRYIIRPRLIGLMNGLALGLSGSWALIWLKAMSSPMGAASCKFGWMILLFLSPFLFIAALRLGFDLWRKTEPKIARIATTFSVLGVVLSLLFVYSPMVHSFVIQALIVDAKAADPQVHEKSVALLRSVATDADLRPSKHSVSGLGLAELLFANRGLEGGYESDAKLFFELTGAPLSDSHRVYDVTNSDWRIGSTETELVGSQVAGLSLAKSQISANMDSASLSSSVDWTLTFRNISDRDSEARAELLLPVGAVVSRATLWVNGAPQDGAFAPTKKAKEAYQAVVGKLRDPLLVTSLDEERVLVQCFPVQHGSEMKIRLGLKVPLITGDGKNCVLKLPIMRASNFRQPGKHRLKLVSHDPFEATGIGSAVKIDQNEYVLEDVLKSRDAVKQVISMRRPSPLKEFAVADWFSNGTKFIRQSLKEHVQSVPKRLFIVIDASESLKDNALDIHDVLAKIPTTVNAQVYINAKHQNVIDEDNLPEAISLKDALPLLTPDTFVGGDDNGLLLRSVLDSAGEKPGSAVVWIHGPQPIAQDLRNGEPLDLIYGLALYDFKIGSGPNAVLPSLGLQNRGSLVNLATVRRTESARLDLNELIGNLLSANKELRVVRELSKERPHCTIVSDRLVSAQVTALWASEEVDRLLACGETQKAEDLASSHRIVSPVTGAVVLEQESDYTRWNLSKGTYKARGYDAGLNGSSTPSSHSGARFNYAPNIWKADQPSVPAGYSVSSHYDARGGGLIGAPVDPRYGQSNEIGMLSDYGYDTARDVSRVVTLLSWLISIPLGIGLLRGPKKSSFVMVKALALMFAIPTTVHLIGTFLINNFGGLGGGL